MSPASTVGKKSSPVTYSSGIVPTIISPANVSERPRCSMKVVTADT